MLRKEKRQDIDRIGMMMIRVLIVMFYLAMTMTFDSIYFKQCCNFYRRTYHGILHWYSSRSTRDAEIAYFVGVLKMCHFTELYAPVFVAISAIQLV